jgi:large subunit ribosomal protein L5e
MGFIKVVKNKAYFKRFQVKYKRRREGKTDYYARKRLVTQDKNKFGTPKYRFVVRFTNKDIICQVVSSKIKGDICHAAAYSHELPRYGCPVGLTNYSAAYCVGLLCARRLLKKFGLDEKFEGTEEVTAEFEDCFVIGEDEDGPSAFHALLDVGLKRTTLGSKIFAAMKGAFDGGLEIPHNEKKFYGYDADEKEYDAEANRERILGGHVATYMNSLEEEEPEEFEEKFKKYIEAGWTADEMEDKYLGVHKAIRENPEHVPTEKKKPTGDDLMKEKRDGGIRYTDEDGNAKFINRRRRTDAQRKNRVAQKKAFVLSTLAADGDDDDEEEEDEE